jgi:hypothetical protein
LIDFDANDKNWMRRKEAASFLSSIGCPMTYRALEKAASNGNAGKGPAFYRRGWKTVRYHRSDLEAWAKKESRRVE